MLQKMVKMRTLQSQKSWSDPAVWLADRRIRQDFRQEEIGRLGEEDGIWTEEI